MDGTGIASGRAPQRGTIGLIVLCLWLWPAPSRAQQVIDFWSDDTWSTTNAVGQAVGPAMFVCLNTAVPSNCPPGATSWDWPLFAYYAAFAEIPAAHWIWGPGNSAASPSNLASYTFTRTFMLNGPPLAGTVYMTADDRVEVRVNGVLAGIAGSIQVPNTWPLATVDIMPLLVPGQNTIAFTSQNGPTTFGLGQDSYSNNPAGVVFGGRIVAGVGNPPGPPSSLSASVSGRDVQLAWGPPVGGGVPSSYTLLARLTPGGPVVGSLPLGDVLSFSLTAPDGVYFVSIQGTNASGPGAESNLVPVTIPTVAQPLQAPVGLMAPVTGATVDLSWSPPPSGPLPTAYLLEVGTVPWFAAAVGTVTVPAATTSLLVPNVPPGVYYVRLRSVRGASRSVASAEQTVVVGGAAVPAVPTIIAAQVVGRTVTLTWTAGPGPPPTHYLLAAAPEPDGPLGPPVAVAGTSLVVANVPSGTYSVVLRAMSAAGASSPSAPLPVVVP